MTTRETSREAFNALRASGKILGAQLEALEAVVKHGPATSGEVIKAMGYENVNLWRARFTELQARGLIVESGVRSCRVSGRRGLVWEYTGRTTPLARVPPRATAKTWQSIAERALKLIGSPGPRGLEQAVGALRSEARDAGARL